MRTQLVLIDTTNDWRLDERTKEVGRKGLAAARAALARAAREQQSNDATRSSQPAA